jgi:penicillin-binding protein 1B
VGRNLGSRRGQLAVLAALALGVLLLGASTLAPLELPELDVPSRVYARPHRIVAGQNLETSGLIQRLRRLGYREVRTSHPRPGEFELERRRLVLNRRPFRTPLASAEEGVIELRVDRTRRISSIRTATGRRLASAMLEPEVVGEFHGRYREDRYLVPLEEMPVQLVDAVLAIEDRRFFEHAGMDWRRLVGAMLANLRAMKVVQGGSTLTQQLVKNVFLSDERTLARKLREAWLALRVERSHSKEEILEAYLNTIYMGQRGSVSVRGMEAAARHYFGKHATELSLSEAALLAGLIRGPGLYSPFTVPDSALARRDKVLQILRDTDKISDGQYEAAVQTPLSTLSHAPEAVSAPYFTAFVRRELQREYPEIDLDESRLAVHTGLDAALQLLAQKAVLRGLQQLEADFPHLLDEDSPLQAALIALDPRSGEVLAQVGGRSWRRSQFDRATQARRQPGSVFKPIVALAALSRGPDGRPAFTLASTLIDEPLEVDTPEGVWAPENYDETFHGHTDLRSAIEDSINVPVARLGLALGPERIVTTARRMGIQAPLQPVPSLALGAFEISPLEIASAYSVLAANGVRREPRTYLHVVDIDGRHVAVGKAESHTAFEPDEISLVTSALEGVVNRGTGRALRDYGFRGPAAGKTGTTNDFRDAWFVGYTPEIVAAVWVGFDDARSLGLTGSRAALPIFSQFLIGALGGAGGSDFVTPAGIEIVRINRESGLRAGFGCWGEKEAFLIGTAPEESCGFGGRRRARREEPRAPDGDHGRERRQPGWLRVLETLIDVIEDTTGVR